MGNCCPCFRSESSNHSYERVPDDVIDPREQKRRSMEVPSQHKNQNNNSQSYLSAGTSSLAATAAASQSNNIELPIQNPSISSSTSGAPTAKISLSVDLNALPFKGCEVQQKFNNNQSYQKRFVWLNYDTRTIHMSQHTTKERRHKEASLCDVTSVVAGPPVKKKTQFNEGNSDYCLTVNFKRGGGIDLLFKSKEDRDTWYSTLLNIVAELDKSKA